MNAGNLTRAWAEKTLTEEMIRDYMINNLRANLYHDRTTVDHVAELCKMIYDWSTSQSDYLGNFLTAVVENNLYEAVHAADEKNKVALWLYVVFLYNVAPLGWADRLSEEDNGEG